jgi:hypothetical protein
MTNDDRCRLHNRSARNRKWAVNVSLPAVDGERKGRMMRLYIRQFLRSQDGTDTYGNR